MSEKKSMGNKLYLKVLRILKENSSEDAPMSLEDIGSILYEDYEQNKGNRDKSIKRTIETFFISTDEEMVKLLPVKEKSNFNAKRNKWQLYYEHLLNENQLNILLLSIMQSAHLGDKSIAPIIETLIDIADVQSVDHQYTRLQNIALNEFDITPAKSDAATDVLANMSTLLTAISPIVAGKPASGKQVQFKLYSFDRDRKRTPVINSDKSVRIYQISPMHLAVHQGRFWLIGKNNISSTEKHDNNYSFYPVDLIADLEILQDVDVEETPMDTRTKEKFFAEHFNLSFDKPCYAYIKATKQIKLEGVLEPHLAAYTRIYNAFGKNVTRQDDVAKELGEEYDVFLVKCSIYGIVNWVLENSDHVSFMLNSNIVDPTHKTDVERIKAAVKDKLDIYHSQYSELL